MNLREWAPILETSRTQVIGVGGNRTLDQRIKSQLENSLPLQKYAVSPPRQSIKTPGNRTAFLCCLRDFRNDKAPCGALCAGIELAYVSIATLKLAQCISRATSLVAVKTHDSFDPAGSSRSGDDGESTVAANLPGRDRLAWGSERREIAHTTADSRALCTPAPKGGCAVSCAGRRLATERWHARVKHVSPQTCVPGPRWAGGIAEAVKAWSGSPVRFGGEQ